MPELISAREAAERLGCSHATVTRMCKDETLRSHRIGNALVIDAASLAQVQHRRKAGRPRKSPYWPAIEGLIARGCDGLAKKVAKILGVKI